MLTKNTTKITTLLCLILLSSIAQGQTCTADLVKTGCSTCDGGACLTCIQGSNRIASGGKCLCNTGFYDVGTATCQACSTKVLNCLTCATVKDIFQCQSCYSQYYLKADKTCSPCSAILGCQTCTSETTCTACLNPATNFRQLKTLQCPCITGYYSDGTNVLCKPCSDILGCQTCSSGTVCTVCTSASLRVISSGVCKCPTKYYDDGSVICKSCPSNCQTCGSASGVVTCSVCSAGYYLSSGSCIVCPVLFGCKQCTSATVCGTCVETRKIQGDKCECKDNFYDDGNIDCKSCQSAVANCLTCIKATTTTPPATCQTCKANFFPVGNTCVTCGTKIIGCATCNSDATACTNCQATTVITTTSTTTTTPTFRQLSDNKCPCKIGYYSDGSLICKACSSVTAQCATCQSSDKCASCNPNYYLTTNSNNQNICIECSINLVNCLTCTFTNSKLQCSKCKDGFFLDQGKCTACSDKCQTCSSATVCLACPTNRILLLNGDCLCNTGFYDDGTKPCQTCQSAVANCAKCTKAATTTPPATCQICKANFFPVGNTCVTCGTKILGCTTCNGDATACTNCQATTVITTTSTTTTTPTFRQLSDNKCPCKIGYYSDGSLICKACSSVTAQCATCQSSDKCASCNPNYYLNNQNKCIQCPLNCQTCTLSTDNSVKCSKCKDGFFLNGLECTACSYKCKTCSSATVCLTCAADRTPSTAGSGECLCNTGFYDDGISACKTCQSAVANCAACTKAATTPPATCQTCKANFFPVGNTCVTCGTKILGCTTCNSDATACSTCQTTIVITTTPTTTTTPTFRQLSDNKCPCKIGYYSDGSLICKACSQNIANCSTCNYIAASGTTPASLRCLTCSVGFYLNNNNINNKCQPCSTSLVNCATCVLTPTFQCQSCISTYYLSGVTCVACSTLFGCQTCSSATVCLTCAAPKVNFRSINQGKCDCQDGYYSDGNVVCKSCSQAVANCFKCKYVTATAPTPVQCESCITGYYLSINTCLECATRFANCTQCSYLQTNDGKITTTLVCDRCISGYYLESNSCKTCSIILGCISCFTSTQCNACAINSFRSVDENGQCVCNPQYYSDGNLNCISCSSSIAKCSTCTFSKTGTTTSLQCNICQDGYYLSGNTCLACTNNLANCRLCQFTPPPGVTTPVFQCIACAAKYYSSTEGCSPCSSAIIGCQICASSTVCTTCAATDVNFRFEDAGKCPCITGYYYDQVNIDCKPCSKAIANCLTCSFGVLPGTTAATPQCVSCEGGFYLNGNNCVSCKTNLANCATCQFVSSAFQCLSCGPSYYLNNNVCVLCSSSIVGCANCTSATTCINCAATATNFRLLRNGQCPCNTGYYYDQINVVCKSCSASISNCGSCTYTAASGTIQASVRCDNCFQGFYLLNNACTTCALVLTNCGTCQYAVGAASPQCLTCTSRYYLSNNICNTCSIILGCQNCTSATICTGCVANNFRGIFRNQCPCNLGFYSDGNIACKSCSLNVSNCQECTYKAATATIPASVTCTLCPNNFYLRDNKCTACTTTFPNCATCQFITVTQLVESFLFCKTCNPQYYLITNTECGLCSAAILGCLNCTSSAFCTACLNPAGNFRQLVDGQCKCLTGYYSDGSVLCKTCDSAYPNCATCSNVAVSGLLSKTIQCNSCKNGFYLNTNGVCSPCTTGLANCATCQFAVVPPAASASFQCTSCASSYYLKNNVCTLCSTAIFGCQACDTTGTSCTQCISPAANFRSLVNGRCQCIAGYYSVEGTIPCRSCTTVTANVIGVANCASCTYVPLTVGAAPSVLCNACVTGYYLVGNSCVSCTTQFSNCGACRANVIGTTTQNFVCLACSRQYYFKNSLCSSCSNAVTACATCTTNQNTVICNTCTSGFYYNSVTNSCLRNCSAIANAATLKLGSNTECTCNALYYWEDNQCKSTSGSGTVIGLSVAGGVFGLAAIGGLVYVLTLGQKKAAAAAAKAASYAAVQAAFPTVQGLNTAAGVIPVVQATNVGIPGIDNLGYPVVQGPNVAYPIQYVTTGYQVVQGQGSYQMQPGNTSYISQQGSSIQGQNLVQGQLVQNTSLSGLYGQKSYIQQTMF